MSKGGIDYSTDQLKVPPDYGVATCPECGQPLTFRGICLFCNLQFDQEDIAYLHELRVIPVALPSDTE